MSFKQSFTGPMPSKIEEGYKKKGISTFHSPAKFLNENQLQVGDTSVHAGKIILSTGAKPRPLNIPGSRYALTSTDFLDLKKLPQSILFIGGGYVAFEFAHLAARCGSEVTIVHRGDAPLENFEQDIVKHLMSATEELGIHLVLGSEVTEIKKQDSSYEVIAENEGGKKIFSAACIINSAGRIPAISDLDLGKGKIKFSDRGIEVNEYLQSTSNQSVYAGGDTADTKGLPLTPVAVMEGHIIASNIIKGRHKKPEYKAIPTVVFTLPPMASVGLTEKEAKSLNLNFRTKYNSASNWFNARRLNEPHYAFKTLVEKDTNKILGAHLMGPEAEETINLFAMAMNADLTTNGLKSMVFSYPTLASDITSMV